MAKEQLEALAHGWRRKEVQALGAALSCRNWHAMEQAYNSLRDKMDAAGCWHEPTVPAQPERDAERVRLREAVFTAVIAHVCRLIECGSFLGSEADDALFAKAVVRRLKQEPYAAFAKLYAQEDAA